MQLDFDSASFKDPDGRVFFHAGQVYRQLNGAALSAQQRVLEHPALATFGKYLVPTRIVNAPVAGMAEAVLWHERLPIISYCYEWLAEQLRDAARLTLQLQLELIQHDFTLKDATPFNVLFSGSQPLFIDWTSITPLKFEQPWLAFTEFLENFLYPLLVRAYLGLSPNRLVQTGLGKISTAEAYQLLRQLPFYKKGVLKYVRAPYYVQTAAQKHATLEGESRQLSIPKAILEHNCRELLQFIEQLKFPAQASPWADYTATRNYSAQDQQDKLQFLQDCLATLPRVTRALDLGANTGQYSRVLCQAAEHVVAVEADEASLNAVYVAAKTEGLRLYPLLMNLAQPSPAVGWDNQERPSFLERFRDSDLVLALALIHHLRFSGNIPLARILDTLARLGRHVLLEWVPPTDAMVQRLRFGKDLGYADYSAAHFSRLLAERFEICADKPLAQGRKLFLLRRRTL